MNVHRNFPKGNFKAIVALPAVIMLVLVFGILFFAGEKLIGLANIKAWVLGDVAVGSCIAKEGVKLTPLIGYYSCEPQGYGIISTKSVPDTSWYDPLEEWTTCCDYNLQSCDFKLMNSDLSQQLASSTVVRSGCVTYKKDSVFTGQRYVTVWGDPFALVRYSPTSSPETVSVADCRLPSTSNLLKKVVEYVGGGSLLVIVNPTDSLDFNQKSSFLADWTFSPAEYAYYGGKYCASGGYLYPTQTVELVSGCYIVPNLNVQPEKALGCPGEPCSVGGRAGIVDGSYNCIQAEGSQCSILNPCPNQGRYAVDWNKDSSGKTAVVYSCVDGYCEPLYKSSECASNSACPAGYQCQFDASSGVGTCKSVGTTPIPPPILDVPGTGFDFWRFVKNTFTAMLVSGVLLFVLIIAGRFFAPLRLLSSPVRNPRMFVIIWIVLSLILMFVFAVPVASISAGIFGGL